MIEMVTLAEERLKKNRKAVFVTAQLPQRAATRRRRRADPARRGRAARIERTKAPGKRLILDFRTSDAILQFRQRRGGARYAQAGVITPDHTIRTKNWPMIAPAPDGDKLDEFRKAARAAAAEFVDHYQDYFARNNARFDGAKNMLDPCPRVILVPGLGLFGLGRSKKDARIAADLAEAAVEGITDAEAIGTFSPIGEEDMFDCEYWSLEQAKLGTREGAAARRPGRGDHRRRRRDRRRDRESVRRRGRGSGAARSR